MVRRQRPRPTRGRPTHLLAVAHEAAEQGGDPAAHARLDACYDLATEALSKIGRYSSGRITADQVSVKGTGGVAATVVVTVGREYVRVSIQPLLTWEAIIEPGKVNELMHALELAREGAVRMAATRKVG